ncbi:MAG: AraC family transcriptional regulator [Synergistaceae bacterium]|jgi:AraC-like DNA-binding protein|nr:AraC family transcriptional regulator [Synergistaceae bacterium]
MSLKIKLLELLPETGKFKTAIDGLYLYRRDEDVRIDCFNSPCIGIIVQGGKRAVIADEEYQYTEGHYIATGIDLPSIVHVIGASPKKPHLAIAIALDRYVFSQLAGGIKPALNNSTYKGVTVGDAAAELLEASLRLLNLLDTPERIPVLAPMIIREIHYYLLIGPQGEDFRLLGTLETSSNRIAWAVSWLRENYKERIHINALAAQVNMTVPSFSRHFKRFTGMSPLQFQKRLRLYEAQLLMLSENKNAEATAFAVGYDSVTQFSREYKRQFGESPHKDIKRLRASAAAANGEILSAN